MTLKTMRFALVVALGFAALPSASQKAKKPSLPPGELFFTHKGQPFALERLVPGIQAALLLSDEQKLQLMDALERTIWSEPVRAAGRLLKEGPDSTEAQREEARRLIRSARMSLSEQVARTLTPEQKALIVRIDAATLEAHATARKSLEVEFSLTKTDKSRLEDLNRQLREQTRAELDRLLEGILTPEQREAVEQAAQQQKAAEEAAKKKGK